MWRDKWDAAAADTENVDLIARGMKKSHLTTLKHYAKIVSNIQNTLIASGNVSSKQPIEG